MIEEAVVGGGGETRGPGAVDLMEVGTVEMGCNKYSSSKRWWSGWCGNAAVGGDGDERPYGWELVRKGSCG